MTVPTWLKQHLVDTGRWNHDGVTRHAVVRTHTCGAPVVVGLDGDICAAAAIADPTPLSTVGEALAQLTGRGTYALWSIPYLHLERRVDQWTIAGHPAGTNTDFDVVAAHVCDTAPLPSVESVLARPETLVMAHEPPF